MSRLKTFLLLNCLVFTGILGNLHEPTIHYKQENHQACFHVSEPPPLKNAQWSFENTFLGDDKDINPSYKNKVTINPINMTLCINNMSALDTGLYEFTHMNINYTLIKHKHKVFMEKNVPKPQMTVKSVLLSNQSALPCNFNVTCSIQNHLLVSFCEEKSCETSQGTFGNLNISVYVKNKTVVCSGNNHVSATAISQSLPPQCFADDHRPKDDKINPSVLYSIIGFFIALFSAAFLIACGISKFRHHQTTLSTVRITQSAPLQRDQRPEPRLSESSSSDAEPSYENLDDTRIRERSSPTEDQEVKEVERVDTVYSVLGAASSSIQPDSRKSAAQNGLTSEYAIANEPQSTAETDCKSQQEKKE